MDERRRAQRFDDFDSYMRFDNTYEDQITGITGVPVNAVTSFFTTDRFTGSNAVRFIAPTGGFTYSYTCLLYTSPSPRDRTRSRMPSSA